MRIWIDIENPPQVQYLAPFRESFAARGCEVVVTARGGASITVDLLRQRGIESRVVGRPHGHSTTLKMLDVAGRAARLAGAVARHRPDMLLATSRASALAAWTLRIPVFGFCDYEHVDMRVLRLTGTRVFHPDVIDAETFTRQGIARDRLLPFPGLKETISFSGIDVDAVEPYLPREGKRDDMVRVLLRPPGEQTHYFVPESMQLALELLGYLADRPDVVVLYPPRYQHQASYLDRFTWKNQPILLEDAVPFVPLLKSVDLVVSSGGTMLREAAYLGIPAYSILRSAIGQVDRYLESIGRLSILESRADFGALRLERLERLDPMPLQSDDLRRDLTSRMLDLVQTRGRRGTRSSQEDVSAATGSNSGQIRLPVSSGPTDGTFSTAHPLATLLRPVEAVPLIDTRETAEGLLTAGGRVVCSLGEIPAGWLRAGDWRLFVASSRASPSGDVVEQFTRDDGTTIAAVVDEHGDVQVPFSLGGAFSGYTSEGWTSASDQQRLSVAQLDLFYRLKRVLPRSLQLALRRRFIARQGLPSFPSWPVDNSVGRLLNFYARCSLLATGATEAEFLWFWPEAHSAALILTHDVEGPEGIRLALELADLEEELGFRSSFNFGAWYDIDPAVLQELRSRGFEIGSHGLVHDRSLFSSRAAFESQLDGLARAAERLGAEGFRSPATHRTNEWLAELPALYDCTIPNSDPYEPQPGGCCSVWPFFLGQLVELPYTLPQDHTLLTLLRHRTPDLWLDQAAAIEREHGLIQCVSHPDRGYMGDADKRAVYADFLRGMVERDGIWRALPRDAASWWRRRASAKLDDPEMATGRFRLADAPDGVVFEASGGSLLVGRETDGRARA
jgi:predicted glycosyltransferase/peptidoglycan/xylan/chitin deacetylase (PgdA/CDA1 family)